MSSNGLTRLFDQLGAGGSAIMAVSHIIIALLVSFVTIFHSVIVVTMAGSRI